MLLKDFIRDSRQAISHLYPGDEAAATIAVLCSEIPGVTRVTHIVEPSSTLPPDMEPWLHDCIRRLAAGEPLQYVLGKAEFYGRSFVVSPAVLIPRPETELLVRETLLEARRRKSPLRILDLCTGSGCIAWTLAAELSEASVVAVDISRGALDLARTQNVTTSSAPFFIEADVLDPEFPHKLMRALCAPETGCFDIIVSNPPYVREAEKVQMRRNVLDHEPHLALFVPDDDPLLFYRAVASAANILLAPGGFGCVEINEALADETAAEIASSGLGKTHIFSDFCNKNRIISFEKSAL